MKKELLIIISIMVLFTISFSGCFLSEEEDTDPDVEFYYYIKVLNKDGMPYKLSVPVPESNKITKDISVKSGSAMIEVALINNTEFLQIESTSSLIIISSSFKEFEYCKNPQLSSNEILCNISGNISIIIESIKIYVYEGTDPHYLYYSYSIYNDSLNKELSRKNNWKSHLPDEYSLEIYQGWNLYNISRIEGYRID